MRQRASASLLLLVVLIAGCGDTRQKALSTSFVALNALQDGFVAWDAAHQDQIVDQATSADEAKQKIATYRAARVRVVEAFTAAYLALWAASLDLNDTTYREAMKAGKEVLAAFSALRKGDPK